MSRTLYRLVWRNEYGQVNKGTVALTLAAARSARDAHNAERQAAGQRLNCWIEPVAAPEDTPDVR